MFEFVYVIPGCDLSMLHEVFVEAYEDGDIPYYELDFIVAVFPKRGSIYSRETLTRVTIPMGGDKRRFVKISELLRSRGPGLVSRRFTASSDGSVYLADEQLQREMSR